MILLCFAAPRAVATIAALYGMIVAQARSPGILPRLRRAGHGQRPFRHDRAASRAGAAPARARSLTLRRLGQELFDLFCHDMDANMREMGVGDLAVPEEMRRVGEAFYGRQAAYQTGARGRRSRVPGGQPRATMCSARRPPSAERCGARWPAMSGSRRCARRAWRRGTRPFGGSLSRSCARGDIAGGMTDLMAHRGSHAQMGATERGTLGRLEMSKTASEFPGACRSPSTTSPRPAASSISSPTRRCARPRRSSQACAICRASRRTST